MHGQPGHNKRPLARLPTSFLGMDAWRTLQINVTLICKLRGSFLCLADFFDMLSRAVCTTRHWRTSGWLVQELNVCTVVLPLIDCLSELYHWNFWNKMLRVNKNICFAHTCTYKKGLSRFSPHATNLTWFAPLAEPSNVLCIDFSIVSPVLTLTSNEKWKERVLEREGDFHYVSYWITSR